MNLSIDGKCGLCKQAAGFAALLEGRFIGGELAGDGGGEQFATEALEVFLRFFCALACPAVGAEGEAFLSGGLQPANVGEGGGNARHQALIEGGRANGHRGAVHQFGNELGIADGFEVEEFDCDVGFVCALHDGLCHGARALPHRGVEDNDLARGLAHMPVEVGAENLVKVGAPDNAVRRGDHLELEAEEFLCGGGDGLLVEEDDIGVIGLGLLHDFVEVGLVIEAVVGRVVLAEDVHREEEFFFRHVGDHRFGPVAHDRVEELECAVAEGEGFAFLNDLPLPAVGRVVALEGILALGIADDNGIRACGDHRGERTGVVGLGVVANDVIDLGEGAEGLDVLLEVVSVRTLDGVDEGGLFGAAHEVGIVGGAALGLITVEVPHRPVNITDPIDILQKLRLHERIPFYCNKRRHYATFGIRWEVPWSRSRRLLSQ